MPVKENNLASSKAAVGIVENLSVMARNCMVVKYLSSLKHI